MNNSELFTVSISITKADWNRIISLLERESDQDFIWAESALKLIKIIRNQIHPPEVSETKIHLSRDYEDYEDVRSEFYEELECGYDEMEYCNDVFGGYSNYLQLSEDAADLGFPDAETYQNWLDD
ncbi:MAG: hypothetical protein J0L63_18130 [Anaerolineae bacterium]|nr:hypothetical protein [Anaerolineae bacterium]